MLPSLLVARVIVGAGGAATFAACVWVAPSGNEAAMMQSRQSTRTSIGRGIGIIVSFPFRSGSGLSSTSLSVA
jgi:hypothetical protein